MREYDPWVFGLMAEADHKEVLRDLAKAQLARQALAGRATRPSTGGVQRARVHLEQLVGGFTACSRLLFRRRVPKVP